LPASVALYATTPCRVTSRLRVEGLRPKRLAMDRMLLPSWISIWTTARSSALKWL